MDRRFPDASSRLRVLAQPVNMLPQCNIMEEPIHFFRVVAAGTEVLGPRRVQPVGLTFIL